MPKPWWRETIETVFWALVLALILRTFVIQAFWIPSGSMIPTLEVGDRVLVLKFWYAMPKIEPKRGQIAVFKYPVDPRRDFVKRIIGLPGDKVEIRNGTVYVNDKEVKDYSKDHTTDSCELKGKFHLSSDEYFVLGDNRDNSNDSRYKEVGPVKRSKITGRIIFRFYPWKNAGVIRP